MATHAFQQGSGFKVTGGTGGVSGGGSGLTGTTVIDETRNQDDNGGSNQIGIYVVQTGFANAPSSASANSRFGLRFYRSGTSSLKIDLTDDSSASGQAGTSDIARSNRPNAAGSPTTNSFAGATGDYISQYNSGTYYVAEQSFLDGEGFQETTLIAEWNNVTVYTGFSETGSVGQTFTGSDGNKYKIGSLQLSQNVGQSNQRYEWTIEQLEAEPETHYQLNATAAITGIKVVAKNITYLSTGTSGAPVALRTFDGNALGSSGSTDSGWKTSSGDMSTGISLGVIQNTGSLSDDSYTHQSDITLEIWARTATSGDTKLKEIRVFIDASANSTY